MIKVLIIEDEPFAQKELKRLLSNSDFDMEILECLESVEDSVKYFQSHKQPDLIFFDIQLSDGLSFEIFDKVKISAPVIFTTAYDEYAIQAFKVNSINYLLKPIDQQAINDSLKKLHDWKSQMNESESHLSNDQIKSIIDMTRPKEDYKSRIIVKVGDQIKFIGVNDIAYFYAEENEVFLMTSDKRRFIVDYTLDQVTQLLEPKLFYRLNRSFVVNKNAITKVHKYFNSRLKVDLQPPNDEEVLISRVKVAEFLEWMEM